MKTRLVAIGNSKGVRLPKPLILEAGLTDDVELSVQNGAIVIANAAAKRTGWAAAARELRRQERDRLLDPPAPTAFDEKEWEW